MKILYIPLDERPCNYDFPSLQLPAEGPVTLYTLPKSLLSHKKQPGNIVEITAWMKEHIFECDAAVLSIETLFYGGLMPSRLHLLSKDTLTKQAENIELILKSAAEKGVRIYLFGLIMRTPSYSSSEEEPEYYEEYGARIFRRAYLKHKLLTQTAAGLRSDEAETSELKSLDQEIPKAILADFEGRREKNKGILQRMLTLALTDTIQLMIIPEDDTSEFGYGPMEKEELMSRWNRPEGREKILNYPGADEVGCTLVARSVLDAAVHAAQSPTDRRSPVIAPVYREEKGKDFIPKYESIPLRESVKAQILASGAGYSDDPDAADIILAVNTGTGRGEEASQQPYRDPAAFISVIKNYRDSLKPVAFGDTAFPNGGETAMIKALEKEGLLSCLTAYAGWNTSGNTLGTVISRAVIEWLYPNEFTREINLLYRISDDWAYQSILRPKINGDMEHAKIAGGLNEVLKTEVPTLVHGRNVIASVSFPWDRSFEIALELSPSKPLL